jgi:hypothetical protein
MKAKSNQLLDELYEKSTELISESAYLHSRDISKIFGTICKVILAVKYESADDADYYFEMAKEGLQSIEFMLNP